MNPVSNYTDLDYNINIESEKKHNVYPILTLSLMACMTFQRGNSRTIKCIVLLINLVH